MAEFAIVQNEKEENTKKLKWNFGCLYLRIGWVDFLQIGVYVAGISVEKFGFNQIRPHRVT